jgi:alcohol dehydrogenase
MKTRAAILETIGLPAPYAQSQPLKIREVELDEPGEGEVLIRIRAAGLCHSDLSVISGDRPRPVPMAIGHESAAEVVSCGPGVHDLKPGDRVVMVFMPSCGCCAPCAEGRPALCEPGAVANGAGTLLSGQRRLHLGGKDVHHHLGVSCFAEHAVVSRRSCVKIDFSEAELSHAEAALFGCAVLTGTGEHRAGAGRCQRGRAGRGRRGLQLAAGRGGQRRTRSGGHRLERQQAGPGA